MDGPPPLTLGIPVTGAVIGQSAGGVIGRSIWVTPPPPTLPLPPPLPSAGLVRSAGSVAAPGAGVVGSVVRPNSAGSVNATLADENRIMASLTAFSVLFRECL